MFALHKYNMYREMLFVCFIALLVLYCTGLMRDLRKGDSGSDSDDSDLEEIGLPVEEEEDRALVRVSHDFITLKSLFSTAQISDQLQRKLRVCVKNNSTCLIKLSVFI